jgi:hypothetical protein
MAAGMYQVRSEMPPWINDAVQKLYAELQGLQFSGGPRSKEFVAGTNEMLKKAFDDMQRVGVSEEPYDFNRAASKRAAESFTNYVPNYLNPYRNEVLDVISKRGNENFINNILPQIENTFIRKGQHGSKRHADISTRAAAAAQEGISDRQSKMLSDYYNQAADQYNTERLRSLMAARQGIEGQRSMQGQNLAQISALGEMGNLKRGIEQQNMDFEFGNQRAEKNRDEENILRRAAFLSGVPLPGSESHYNMMPPQAHPGVMSNLGGLAASLLGARMAGGGR